MALTICKVGSDVLVLLEIKTSLLNQLTGEVIVSGKVIKLETIAFLEGEILDKNNLWQKQIRLLN